MWPSSGFLHLSSAVTGVFSLSLASQILPRARLPNYLRRSYSRTAPTRFAQIASMTAGNAGESIIPEDVCMLLRNMFESSPSPRVCVSTTGSGGQAISWMMGVPGASACLLEASVPYSRTSCDKKMGGTPPTASYCTPEVAEKLAREAYARAVGLCVVESERGPYALTDGPVVGVGCTASVATGRPKRGQHRCFVCAQTHEGISHYELVLAKGRRSRSGEDAVVSRVVLQAMAEAVGLSVPEAFKMDHLMGSSVEHGASRLGSHKVEGHADVAGLGESDGEAGAEWAVEMMPQARKESEPDAIQELVEGRSCAVLLVPDPKVSEPRGDEGHAVGTVKGSVVVLRDVPARRALSRGCTVVLPGSFNPLHRGHVRLLDAARALLLRKCQDQAAKTGTVVEDVAVHSVFELSVANADKGGLSGEEVRKRALQFSDPGGIGWPSTVVLSRAPLFSEKARLFPGCAFVVGADTAKRIVDPKYYGNSQVEMVAALTEILHLGCSFIVGGRKYSDGKFVTLDDILEGSGLPSCVRGMFSGLDEVTFREDLSSTSIREGTADPGLLSPNHVGGGVTGG